MLKAMRAKNRHDDRRGERGAALLELAIGSTIFLSAMFGVLEVGRLIWVHNSLVDATRRAARYAVNQGTGTAAQTAAKNMAVYGNTAGTGQPLVQDLTVAQVKITYQNFELGGGTVTAEIENYDFSFVLPLVSRSMRLPAYRTTLTAENAGYVPSVIP
ncbi:MAG TPA: TadE/TadG family type IV pilus assembly protein [Pyrinomonadaceae bacterium]|jgi:Flp pilus assembly protein TadG